MSRRIAPEPLTAGTFASFGEVLGAAGPPDRTINEGACGRWHDRARLDFGPGGARASRASGPGRGRCRRCLP